MVSVLEVGRFLNSFAKNSEQLTLWLIGMDKESMYCCMRLFLDTKWRKQLMFTWKQLTRDPATPIVNSHDKCDCIRRWRGLMSKHIVRQIGKCDYCVVDSSSESVSVNDLLTDESFSRTTDASGREPAVVRLACQFDATTTPTPAAGASPQEFVYYSDKVYRHNLRSVGYFDTRKLAPKYVGAYSSSAADTDKLTIVQLFRMPHHKILQHCTPLEAYVVSTLSLNVTVNDITRSLPDYYRVGIRNLDGGGRDGSTFDLFHGMYNFHVARSVYTCDTNLMAYYKLPQIVYKSEELLRTSDLNSMCAEYCVQPCLRGIRMCICLTEDSKYYTLNEHGVRVRINNRCMLRALPVIRGVSHFCGEFVLMGTNSDESCVKSYASVVKSLTTDEHYCLVLIDLYLLNGKSLLGKDYEQRLRIAAEAFKECTKFTSLVEVADDGGGAAAAAAADYDCVDVNAFDDALATGVDAAAAATAANSEADLWKTRIGRSTTTMTTTTTSTVDTAAPCRTVEAINGIAEYNDGVVVDIDVDADANGDGATLNATSSSSSSYIGKRSKMYIIENYNTADEILDLQEKCNQYNHHINGIIVKKRYTPGVCNVIIKIPFIRQHWRLVSSQGFECELTLSKYTNPYMSIDDMFPNEKRLWLIEQQSFVQCKFNAVCYKVCSADAKHDNAILYFAINNGKGVYVHFFSVKCVFNYSTLCYDLNKVSTVKSSRIIVHDEPREWFVCTLGFAETGPPFKTLNSLNVRFDLSLSDCVNSRDLEIEITKAQLNQRIV